ncbi:Putative stretch-activated cation channel Mid1/Calcium influx-promoting protein Ehs1 [Septoria linicola]|uniref:Stretch-activated cation channel Mid1/Calcium influx-promoting protein Ehs1 n=1 Tax=Septoria linicola TaxID=215465 RepID=A0A9Q9AIV0_9PEZI|nr:Putative stretch-activated cation channel Mid1/Calcium influx-promoting protein Ehs1 [Septoria linicola]
MRCQCPKLTPLQTRLIASLGALALIALVYWSLSHPHFAYAAELAYDGSGQLSGGGDHNWHRIEDALIELEDDDDHDNHAGRAATDHHGTNTLASRQTDETQQISGNNIGTPYDISPGSTTVFQYPSRFLEANRTAKGVGLPSDLSGKRLLKMHHPDLRRRQDSDRDRTIYISANVCSQPTRIEEGIVSSPPPGQLTLYVSSTSSNTNPGPNRNNNNTQTVHPFRGGFVNASVANASGDWYMAVHAPETPDGFTGNWNYQLAVSIDDYFHAAERDDPFLYQVDTDIDSALLVTDNLTQVDPSNDIYQEWMNMTAPFTLFVVNSSLSGLLGMESSYCGLQTFIRANGQIQANQSDLDGNSTRVDMGMVTRGLGRKPKEQFYVNRLAPSSDYKAYLAMDGNSTASGDGVVGGGGKVWKEVPFRTKTDGNCQLLFNLTFCDEVAYAVPANPSNPEVNTLEALQNFYENYTQTWYIPFNYTLAQIPCNTTAAAKYSLAKGCDDCAAAYKEWLCAVSIPRCEDFSNPAAHLQVRNVGQAFYNDTKLEDEFLHSNYISMDDAPTVDGTTAWDQTYISSFATNRSRNGQIDDIIKPGPYKEVLPCEDLCYSLMQSCPASMQFACPYPGRGLERGYGKRDGDLTCSYLGAVYYMNDGMRVEMSLVRTLGVAVVTGLVAAFV